MQVLYFGWVKSKIGRAAEDVEPPADVADVAGLIAWLKGRGGGYAEAFANVAVVRAAVNQELTPLDTPIRPGDEVALFPPMTGG
jgi:molybdopterin synthase sulfur carrier subunit